MKQPANNEVVLRDANGDWLHFRSPQKVLCAHTSDQVIAVLDEAAAWDGWAAGYVGYESAPAFDFAFPSKISSKPLAWFGLYDAPENVTLPNDVQGQKLEWTPDTAEFTHASQVKQIKEYIREGDTYQVNHTIRLHSHTSDAWNFFLGNMSAAEFSAYIQTDHVTICSASPELFFELDGSDITCRPMKGTAKDAETLISSVKDHAENIMIVDMIRNDLGRICTPGSIEVDPLFEVNPCGSIWQMTSTVKGKAESSVVEIFRALFPCASITGAPKCRTMKIIDKLESSPRGIYCGAIGYIASVDKARFSVAIRTAEIDRASGDAVYGVGGGIVWDSQPESEWNECELKAEVVQSFNKCICPRSESAETVAEIRDLGGGVKAPALQRDACKTQLPDNYQLLETMLYNNGIAYLDEHIERLSRSATELGFKLDVAQLKNKLDSIAGGCQRVRLLLRKDGEITIELFDFPSQDEPLRRVAFSKEPVDPENPMLYHKTTHREIYNNAKASVPDVDDVILWNNRSEVTESTIANVVAEIDGKPVTPPVKCGLLPGTMRAALLEKGEISERIITVEELRTAPKIYLINSLRGWMPAELYCSEKLLAAALSRCD